MKTTKRMLSSTIFILLSVLLIFTLNINAATSSETVEEDANTVLPNDIVTTGEINKYSKDAIIVNDIRYIFCSNVKVYNTHNRLIFIQDLDAAEEVKLFENKRCVRKIKVLRFGE